MCGMNSDINSVIAIIAMAAAAAASGLIGVFALTRRMTLAADVISHIALPGLGVAVLLNINPLIGGAAALILGAFLIWALERRTRIATETIIGVVFAASLAIGSLLINSGEELLDALFGDSKGLSFLEAGIGIIVSFAIIFLVIFLKEKFTLAFISPDLAKTSGLKVDRLNLAFMLMFVITVILGLKFLGVLLMGALIIVPAAASRNLAKSFNADLLISSLISLASVMIGFLIARKYELEIGPAIIAVASLLFFVSVFFKKQN